jgi:hypothetical protein
MFCNGNNVSVAEDMVRRCTRSGLDANLENPETREFKGNPVTAIRQNRGQYISAVLTIALAYIAAGRPAARPPLISFEEWSRVVREPLIWLGSGDPVKTQEKLRTNDPRKAETIAIFEEWKPKIGLGKDRHCVTKDIVACAEMHPKFHEALFAVAPQRGLERKIDGTQLGKWLSAHEGVIANGCKLLADRSNKTRPKWYLDPM